MSLLLEKCEIATHSIDVLPPINLTWEARKLILPKLLEDNMLELPDDTELNDLVIMSIFLTNGDFIIISYIYSENVKSVDTDIRIR